CDFLGNKLKDKFILFSELSHTIDCKALNFTLYGDDLVGVMFGKVFGHIQQSNERVYIIAIT
ncbi:MAG: hypothetical protein LBU65_17370, partial [Planctomycetaceae bacterium]|nr:hypothetical protein [Planctomycetaceae bacterium]